MIKSIIILLTVFSGCSADVFHSRTYEINGGEVICQHREFEECGVKIWSCSDGKIYHCMTDLVEL